MINKLVLCGASTLLMLSGPAVAQKAAAPNDAQIAHIAYTAGHSIWRQASRPSPNRTTRLFVHLLRRWFATMAPSTSKRWHW